MKSFRASLADHAANPRNAGALDNATAVGHGRFAGERPFVTIYLLVSIDTITRATFQTRGCGYAIGASSALTEWITGKTIEQCKAITSNDLDEALGGLPPHKKYCAELACDALEEALTALAEPLNEETDC